ncbi:MAG TPA: cell division protein FtsQ/DivIB [Candidatus Kapabacteria bacterium]|nr:cell division protein FtsQ/DivIB [Candidatus Kapabacteria bacterium]
MKVRIKLIPKRRASRRSPEEARRFASHVSTALLIAGVLVGLVMVANRWARREELRSIRIVGRTILDSAEIMRYAAIGPHTVLEQLDLDSVEHRVLKHPFIERASAYRGENGTLVMEIAERLPVAVMIVNGSPVYLDSTGVMLPYRFSSTGFDLPLLAGIEQNAPRDTAAAAAASAHAPAAGPARVAAGPAAAMVPDSAHAREALAVLASIRRYDEGLYRQISEVHREPSGEYTLVMSDGAVPVLAGTPAEIVPRLKKLDRFMTTVLAARGAEQAEQIDLRWKGEVVVRWRRGSAQL